MSMLDTLMGNKPAASAQAKDAGSLNMPQTVATELDRGLNELTADAQTSFTGGQSHGTLQQAMQNREQTKSAQYEIGG